MWHYGSAKVEQESEGTFDTSEQAIEAAQEASHYRDDVLQVWSDDDPEYPPTLCWGGTVYTA